MSCLYLDAYGLVILGIAWEFAQDPASAMAYGGLRRDKSSSCRQTVAMPSRLAIADAEECRSLRHACICLLTLYICMTSGRP